MNLTDQLDECLKNKCSYIYSFYQEPLPEKFIDEYLDKMNIDDESYKSLYSWRNGLNLDDADNFPNEMCILFWGNFISLEDSYSQFRANENSYFDWPPSQVVIMDKLMGERLLYETNTQSPYYKFVFCYAPFGNNAGLPIPCYDSIDKMIETIIELYKNDAISYNEETQHLHIDFEKEDLISREINPLSKYWQS